MSQVRVIAIDAHDGYGPGEDYLTTERQARQLITRHLVKMAADIPRNKMMPAPLNKGSPPPLPDAGEVLPSSPSPAAPVSPPTTAPRSARGVRGIKTATKMPTPKPPARARRVRAAVSSS